MDIGIIKPISLNVPAIDEVDNNADQRTSDEMRQYDKVKRGLENTAFYENIKARKRTARCLFWLIAFWLVSDMIVIFAQGMGHLYIPKVGSFNFVLTDRVLITLITSTTASVISLFAIVVRNLFPR